MPEGFHSTVHPALASEASASILRKEPDLRDAFTHGATFTGGELERYTQAIFLMGVAEGIRSLDTLLEDKKTPLLEAVDIAAGDTL